ncbi:MAG: transcription antitermination factor NusB [Hyphomicrobiales bacterium]|nr:transcription antitermination factor NusB [Rickettsiales bacterium]MCP5361569.1 transcription antitermination factor NusB [Hyphomicrobiales bacterium]
MADSPLAPGMLRKRASRLLAVQALYGTSLEPESPLPMVEHLIALAMDFYKDPTEGLESVLATRPNNTLLRQVLEGVMTHRDTLDGMIAGALESQHRPERLLAVQRAVLYCAAYELAMLQETPSRAIVNEYVTLAHMFMEPEEAGLLNGILNRLARELRSTDFV